MITPIRSPSSRPLAASCWIVLAALVCSGHALAQGDARKASADMLFDEARRLMSEGNVAEACPKFVASHKLDPAAGTLLNLGDCYEKAGKTASAWSSFREAADLCRKTGDTRRQQEATNRAAALRPRLSMVTIALAPAARVEGLKIRADEVDMDMGVLGTPVPLDPGAHTLRARAPGKQPWSTQVQLADGASITITVPALVDAAASASAPPEPLGPAASPTPAAPATPEPAAQRRWFSQRNIGIGLTGVGAIGVLSGGILAIAAKSSWDDARSRCPDNQCASQNDVAQSQDARSRANIGGVLLGMGAACAVTGAVLWWLAPSSSSKAASPAAGLSPVVAPGYAGLGMNGGFW